MTDEEDVLRRFRLDGRTVVLTGASSGLGARFAAVLHAAGANVVAGARRQDRLEAVMAGMERGLAVRCDVAEEADRQALVEAAVARFGRVDVLVNNAGTTEIGPAESESADRFRAVIEVNLLAAHRLCQLCGSRMLEQGSGVIVNVASILGMVGLGQIPQASYATSKAGLIGLTLELAAQWARRGVRVNALAPGWFPSELTAEMTEEGTSGRRWIETRDPMGRPGREDELDGALLFLASDASSYVTGQVLAVDGGWTAI